jgi:hypothetical protein
MGATRDNATVNIFDFAHDRDGRARNVDHQCHDLTFRSIIEQAIMNVVQLQFIYSDGV